MGANSLCGFVLKNNAFKSSNEVIIYQDYFKEKKDALYLYVNRIFARLEDDDVLMELESEYLLICKYDKLNNILSNPQNIPLVKGNLHSIEGIEQNAQFTANVATSDFIKRYIYYANPRLFKILNDQVCNYGADYSWMFAASYINDLDNVEKLCKTMSVKDVVRMMENNSLVFEDARKLKQVIGLPSDIISKLDEMEFGYMLAQLQKLRREEMVEIEEIRYLLDFLDSMHILSKKRKLSGLDGRQYGTMNYILECVGHGYKLKTIVNAIAKEVMFYADITKANIVNIIRMLRDCVTMATKMNLEKKICQNFDEWHSILGRNFAVFQKPRNDEFVNAAININNLYSYQINDYLIKCPTTEAELFNIGFAYHNCLPTYRDRIIDQNAIVLSIYRLDKQGDVVDQIPEYTFEINKNLDIVQLKTFFDADVTDTEILDVVKTWKIQMKKKG